MIGSRAINGWIVSLVASAAALGIAGSGPEARGQEPASEPAAHQRREKAGRQSHRGHRGRDGRPGARRGGRHWGRQVFQPRPEDHGPLREGEEQELRDFVRDQFPGLHQLLDRVEQRSPREFRRSFHRLVPRLRQLRRIHQRNPELAQLIGQHAEHMVRAGLLRRAWRHADDEQRENIEHQIRGEIAATVRVEVQVLKHLADHLEATRDERIAERVAALTAADADLSPEPQPVRERVGALQMATGAARRLELETELVELLGRQLDEKIAALRQRAREMKAGAPAEVDKRMRRLKEGPPSRRRKP